VSHERSLPAPPAQHGGTPSIHAQILAAEHWSLLATRTMTWNEIFSRTGTFLTVLSAAVIALSLVAQATGFGEGFRTFAFLVLPVVMLLGLATFIRLVEADVEDAWLIIGMNRVRHAYVEIAPELAQYFVTSHTDDEPGVMRTYAFRTRLGAGHLLAGSPVIVGAIDSLVGGVLVAVICQAAGLPPWLQVTVGVVGGLVMAVGLGVLGFRRVARLMRSYRPLFPTGGAPEAR
jgi:hypothetical protein